MNESEPLMTCRKRRDEVKTGESRCSRISPGRTCLLPGRPPALRWHEPDSGSCVERGNLSLRCQGRNSSGSPIRVRVPMRSTGAEQPVVVMKSRNGDGVKGLHCPAIIDGSTRNGRSR
jgi:hypothetical protein